MKSLFIALVLFLPVLLAAEDIKRADGTILNATIVRDEPDGLVVQTDAGIEKIDFVLLSTEVQKRFAYDPVKAREYRASRAVAQQQLFAQQAATIRAQSAALDEKLRQQPTPEEAATLVRIEQNAIFATATIYQGASKGVRASLVVSNGRAAATMLDKDTRTQTSLGEAFIYGLEGVGGETWQGKLFPAGYYHYVTAFGEEATLRAYALSSEVALKHGADGRGPTIPSIDTSAQHLLPGNLRGGTLLDK
jgi:hypothetical protein